MGTSAKTVSWSDRVLILIGVIGPLLATLVAMIMVWERLVTWPDAAILAGMYFFAGIGIMVGFHRMLTHCSFEAHPMLRFSLLALGWLSPAQAGREHARTAF